MTTYNVNLTYDNDRITGTVESQPAPNERPSDQAAILAFLDAANPAALEAKVLAAGFQTGPAEAMLNALKEIASGRS